MNGLTREPQIYSSILFRPASRFVCGPGSPPRSWVVWVADGSIYLRAQLSFGWWKEMGMVWRKVILLVRTAEPDNVYFPAGVNSNFFQD